MNIYKLARMHMCSPSKNCTSTCVEIHTNKLSLAHISTYNPSPYIYTEPIAFIICSSRPPYSK